MSTSRALIIQGGGFRTAFTAGVLDAFSMRKDFVFDTYLAVSGGTIALSYYLSQQYRSCFEAMLLLAQDPHFVQFSRAMSDAGYMDIDYLERIAREVIPFDLQEALGELSGREIRFVATDRETAVPVYFDPRNADWVQTIIASCTLPFVTKGKHLIGGREYFDGGWSDPVPAQWAIEQGARELLIIRTDRLDVRLTQSWPDYFGSIYFRANPALSKCFADNHAIYNTTLDYLAKPIADVDVTQLAPETTLRSGTYSYSTESLTQDYRHGLDVGMRYLKGLDTK